MFGSLRWASGQWNLVLIGGFKYPDICWKNSTAARVLSIKLLEYIEDCLLIQALDVPPSKEALLDLVLTHQGNLLCSISVSDSLGCRGDNIVEFGILLSPLRVSMKTKVLHFRRTSFSSLRAQVGRGSVGSFPAASECWEFFKSTPIEAQKQFIPFKDMGDRQNKRPLWVNCKLLHLFKTKRGVPEVEKWMSAHWELQSYFQGVQICS